MINPFNHNLYVAYDILDQVYPISDIELVFWIGGCIFDIFWFSFCHTFININLGLFYHLSYKLFKQIFTAGIRLGLDKSDVSPDIYRFITVQCLVGIFDIHDEMPLRKLVFLVTCKLFFISEECRCILYIVFLILS